MKLSDLQKRTEDGKPEWQTFNCPLLSKNHSESMENQLSSSGIFSKDVHHCRFFWWSRRICKSGTLNLKNLEIEFSSCQCSTTLNGQENETERFVFQLQKSQDVREEILARTLETIRSGMRIAPANLRGRCNSIASQMVQQFKETSHPVFTCASALSRNPES